jgi:hypothetical protein
MRRIERSGKLVLATAAVIAAIVVLPDTGDAQILPVPDAVEGQSRFEPVPDATCSRLGGFLFTELLRSHDITGRRSEPTTNKERFKIQNTTRFDACS